MIKQAKHSLIDPDFAEQRAGILRALGNPVRLRIIACLAANELCVGTLCDLLNIPQSSISRQLGWLRLNELVSVRSELPAGRTVDPVEEGQMSELVDRLAPLVRRGQHHDPAGIPQGVPGQILPDHDPPERVGHEVDLAGMRGLAPG